MFNYNPIDHSLGGHHESGRSEITTFEMSYSTVNKPSNVPQYPVVP